MARPKDTPPLASPEEAATVLFCLVDDAYRLINPKWRSHEPPKRLSDSEVVTLALLQQLRGIESERSFLRDTGRFFAHLFPGVVGLHPSSSHRRARKLRCFLEPLRRDVLGELLTPANTPEVLLTGELLDGAGPGDGVARRLLGDLAHRSGGLGGELADRSVFLATERADRRPGVRQHVEVCSAHAYGCRVNRLMGRPQGRIKEPWA